MRGVRRTLHAVIAVNAGDAQVGVCARVGSAWRSAWRSIRRPARRSVWRPARRPASAGPVAAGPVAAGPVSVAVKPRFGALPVDARGPRCARRDPRRVDGRRHRVVVNSVGRGRAIDSRLGVSVRQSPDDAVAAADCQPAQNPEDEIARPAGPRRRPRRSAHGDLARIASASPCANPFGYAVR